MESVETFEPFYRTGLALALGLMIGIERGWHLRDRESGRRAAGVRTFALIGLLGGVSGHLAAIYSMWVLAAAFAALAVLTVAAYLVESRQDNADIGMTTKVAMLLTFAIGAYSVLGDMALAAVVAVAAVVILRVKPESHRLLETVERYELNGAIRLLVISVAILPFLPNRGYGPGEAINPYALWWMVVLIAALSFIGYFAIKLSGPRKGPILGGVFGGLASSTATTLGFSRIAARAPALVPAMALGITLAGTIMFARVFVIAGAIDRPLAMALAVPLAAMILVSVAAGAFVARDLSKGDDMPQLDIGDPADIPSALKFGVLLLVIALASYYLKEYFGDAGTYTLAFVSGLADVDAITVTLAQGAGDEAARTVAARAIVLAVVANTVMKIGISATVGGRALAKRIAPVMAAGALAGLIALIAI